MTSQSSGVTRRDFIKLAISTGAAIGIAAAAFGGGVGVGYAIAESLSKAAIKTVVKTQILKIKPAFIYIGPIGDCGWTFGHDRGRRYVEERLGPILNGTVYVENVKPVNLVSKVDDLVHLEHCDIIFTTSFSFWQQTWEAARKYPHVLFGHCSGLLTMKTKTGVEVAPPNVCEYFTDLYEAYYLCGILAGAMTKTGKVGYIPAFILPEIRRHINAFTIGVKVGAALTGKDPDKVHVYVTPQLGNWVASDEAIDSAFSQILSIGCDVFAFTEDTARLIAKAENYYRTTGKRIWTFSHYSDMHMYGPDVVLSGELINWGPMYEELIVRAYIVHACARQLMNEGLGKDKAFEEALRLWTEWPPERPRDYWWSMHQSHYIPLTLQDAFRVIGERVVGGKTYKMYEPVNVVDIWPPHPAVPENIRNYVLLVRKLIIENKHDPFCPPIGIYDEQGRLKKVVIDEIRDTKGNVRVYPGLRLSKDELYHMDWFVEGVVLL